MSWAKGKRVLVTGGTQGIGRAIAMAFRDLGAEVKVTGTRASADDYEDDLEDLHYVRADLSKPADIARLAAGCRDLDVLVNNAGMSRDDEYTAEGFDAVIAVNLNAAMALSLALHDALARSKGCIVNVGSIASFLSLRATPAYTASKAGLLGLTRALGDQWARDGIRVNMVAPGFIRTRMTAGMRGDPAREERLLRAIPMRRWGEPEDVAGAVVFLASPAAAYITGQSLAMDGGLMLR
jgi:3-oxoacyl-[acyl-carrier protein] reductase